MNQLSIKAGSGNHYLIMNNDKPLNEFVLNPKEGKLDISNDPSLFLEALGITNNKIAVINENGIKKATFIYHRDKTGNFYTLGQEFQYKVLDKIITMHDATGQLLWNLGLQVNHSLNNLLLTGFLYSAFRTINAKPFTIFAPGVSLTE